ncbi:MAG: hypothetical protein MUP21_05975 [Dehalococcoidia bacterium]|nr:hypothetical protein [Dehalococcoidia bacterium]
MRGFWLGFEKRAHLYGVFKGLANATKAPATAKTVERVLDYGAMKAAPKVAPKVAPAALDYRAMNTARTEQRAAHEAHSAALDYSSGKPVVTAKGEKVQTPASKTVPPPAKDPRFEQRIKHVTKGSTPLTDWHSALKEPIGS